MNHASTYSPNMIDGDQPDASSTIRPSADLPGFSRTQRRRIEKNAKRLRSVQRIPSQLGGVVRPTDVRRQQYLAQIGQPHSDAVASLLPATR